jgi:transcriptional regulator with XRE-family HTH domain
MGTFVRGLIVPIYRILEGVNKEYLPQLGQRLRTHRKALGWTQEELADRAEIDRSYVGGVERGERNLTFTVLCQLCTALGCDVAELTHDIPARRE